MVILMQQTKIVNKKIQFFFFSIIVFLPIVVFAVCYFGYVAYRTADIYRIVKTNQRGWKGIVHTADPEVGFRPVPNAVGAHVFPIGPDVPMRYDADGFRVPLDIETAEKTKRPIILSLGCSFTYGDATYAEETYPYLVGQSLQGTSRNAGVCSYGLSQMLLLARKLVPIHKPDILLVQYSPWLVQRAIKPFAPVYYGKLPTPFFYDQDQGFALRPPVFTTKIMGLPVDSFRKSSSGLADWISFYRKVGLPLYLYDDFNMLKYYIYKNIGKVPEPTGSRKQLVKYVYNEIYKVAQQYDTKVVIVVLGKDAHPVEVKDLSFPAGALLVNAQDALLKRLPVVNPESYEKEYAHWRGSPPRVVDDHPNEKAHKIIADTIVSKLTE